ncbi:MAG: small subunit ribosomal protein S1, partial [Maribacter sp.]
MAEEKKPAEAVETVTATPETAEVVQETKEQVPVQDPQEFLENFNWEKYEQGI